MIRTQVSLTEEQMERLRLESRRTGKSIAQLTRDAIDAHFDDHDVRLRRLHAVAGSVKGDFGAVSQNVDDEFVAAALARWRDPD